MAPFFGNSIATRVPLCPSTSPEVLLLGDWRAAQRVCLLISPTPSRTPSSAGGTTTTSSPTEGTAAAGQPQKPGSGGGRVTVQAEAAAGAAGGRGVCRVWLVNTHLDHADDGVRAKQMEVRGGIGEGGGGECVFVWRGKGSGHPREPGGTAAYGTSP
jgi:hypothetical protein